VNPSGRTSLIVPLVLLQIVCVVYFVTDVINDVILMEGSSNYGNATWFEAAATLGLSFGIVFEIRYLRDLMRSNREAQQNIRIATGALNEVISDYFRDWALTPSERDVAMFAIKGMSNGEIAGLRNSSEGTIKAHMNAVFRKARVSGRSQLISLLVEDLMNGLKVDIPVAHS